MIVDMFTRQFGRLSFIVSIPKSSKSKVKKQFFQPLSLLEIETDVRPKIQLQKLSDIRLVCPFVSIPFHPHKLSMALFLAEFLYYALRSEQRNEPLFDYVESSIQWLDGFHAFWGSTLIWIIIMQATILTFVRVSFSRFHQCIGISFTQRKPRKYS